MDQVICRVDTGHGQPQCGAIQAVAGYDLASRPRSSLQNLRAPGKTANPPAASLQGRQESASDVAGAAGQQDQSRIVRVLDVFP